MSQKIILYSKPGCCLCEGLQQKLEQVQSVDFEIEIRDITTREEWFDAYQYEIPVLYAVQSDNSTMLPRLSPRASVRQVEKMLQKYLH